MPSAIVLFALISFVGFFGFACRVSAHVVVLPTSVGIGAFQEFTLAVPTEKNIPTISVRLVVPEGLQSVTPNVTPGWKIAVKKIGTGDDVFVSEIVWSGGSIPDGQRGVFVFNAKMPATPADLQWKAYQTYQDGSVVSWDENPVAEHMSDDMTANENEMKDESELTPYSVTHVVDDISENKSSEHNNDLFVYISLALSLLAIMIARSSGSQTSKNNIVG